MQVHPTTYSKISLVIPCMGLHKLIELLHMEFYFAQGGPWACKLCQHVCLAKLFLDKAHARVGCLSKKQSMCCLCVANEFEHV